MSRRRLRPTARWAIGAAVVVLLVLSESVNTGAFFSKATLSTLTPSATEPVRRHLGSRSDRLRNCAVCTWTCAPGSRGSRRSSCNAVLSGGRVDLMGVALGAVFITVLSHDLRFRGYSSGFAQLVQAIVLAGDHAHVNLSRVAH